MPRLKLKRFRAVEPPPEVLAHYVRIYDSNELYHQPEALPPVSSPVLFGTDRPLAFDLGCGQGEFIAARAADEPELNFVGCDWHWKSLWKAVERVQQAGLDNVRFLRTDFRRVLVCVPDDSAAAVYLLFPPPALTYKRRKIDTLTDPVLHEIHRILRSGALFHFATDAPDYFDVKTALVEASGLFERASAAQQVESGLTRFQQFWEDRAIPSQRVAYRKTLPK